MAAAVLAAQNVGLNIADTAIGTADMTTGISNMFTNTMNYVLNTILSFNFVVFFSLFVSLGKIAYNFVLLILTTIWWVSLVFIPWLIWNPWPPTLFNMGKHDSYIEAAFLPWTIRIIMVIAEKIGKFPKCFLWYLLDIVGWIIYLPFRFLFWLIDSILNTSLQEGDRYVWHLLNDMDYYIHGPVRNYFLDQYVTMYVGDSMYKSGIRYRRTNPETGERIHAFHKDRTLGRNVPSVRYEKFTYTTTNNEEETVDVRDEVTIGDKNSLNTGLHIIHFPDMVMETCYQATGFRLSHLKPFPIECLNKFMSSLSNPWKF